MIIDISQEVLSCKVYLGDPVPSVTKLYSIQNGDSYNLSAVSMCLHNGTHVDVPAHFLKDGNTIDQAGLEAFVGSCYVAKTNGNLTANEAMSIMHKAKEMGASERILLAGDLVVTADAARIFANSRIKLIGNEGQSVGPEDEPMEVHKILLEAGVALLEGIVLDNVKEGKYFLSAAPLNIAGGEGAPCRAYLIDEDIKKYYSRE